MKREYGTNGNNGMDGKGNKRPLFIPLFPFVPYSLFTFCLLFCSAYAQDPQPTPLPSRWQWSFTIRNRTGLRLDEPHQLQMSRTTFDAKGLFKISDDWKLTLEGRAHIDPVERLGYPKTVWFDPRQALLDGRIKKVDVKLGLQQVVWGQADGLRVLDVINPLDYREFILEDFLDSRRPLWMARADLPLAGGSLQTIWIPYFATGRLPGAENEFGLGASFGLGLFKEALKGTPFENSSLEAERTVRPSYKLSSSQAGVRYSRSLGKWDLTANYFRGWEDVPTLYFKKLGQPSVACRVGADLCVCPGLNLSAHTKADTQVCPCADINFTSSILEPSLIFAPRYVRKEVMGGTAATNFGSLVLRLEAGWNRNKPAAAKTSPSFIEPLGQFSSVGGVDWSVRTWLWVSGQYFLQFTAAPQQQLLFPRYNHLTSFYFRTNFFRDTFRPELFVLTGLNQRAYMLRPRVTKSINDHWSVGAGADFLGGSSTNLFGYFDSRDRVVVELKWQK